MPPTEGRFLTEQRCIDILETVRWPNELSCPRCRSRRIRKTSIVAGTAKMRELYRCVECGYQYSATAGTIFHQSHLPLWKWFLAIHKFVSNPGLTAKQLQRELNLGSYKTAWHVVRSLRFEKDENAEQFKRLTRTIQEAVRSLTGVG